MSLAFLFSVFLRLADFFDGLVSNISDISFQMDEKGDFALSSETAIHPYKGDYAQFVNEARHKFESFLCNETKSNQLTYQAESSRFIGTVLEEFLKDHRIYCSTNFLW